MRIPTYLKEENYKVLNLDDTLSNIRICNPLENGGWNERYEIYYYGEVVFDTMIRGIFEEEIERKKPCLIKARCIQTGEEILLYDEAKYGYNPVFCDEVDLEDIKNRPLSKLEIPNSKIEIEFAYNIDFEEEKEDFEFDEEDKIETMSGERMSFEEVQKNCFDSIKITAVDEEGEERVICELELA